MTAFCEKFLLAPKGAGALKPFRVRDWQRDMLACFDRPRPKLAVWSLPRGSGKSSLAAAVALYALHADGVEGARVAVVAVDERQARHAFSAARRMTELSPELAKRTQVYQDRLYVPGTDSELVVMPGEAHRLEGMDLSLAIVDEIGFVGREVYESTLNSTGKRPEGSMVLAIGTPSPARYRDSSPMLDLVTYGRDHPGDPDFHLTEWGAPPGADITDEAVWAQACPGLDDLVQRDHMKALLPPRTRPSEYARARLGMWVEADENAWMPPAVWAQCERPGAIPDGAQVVVGFDGSFSQDTTAIVAASVGPVPHLQLVRLWAPKGEDYRVPVLEVEDELRACCRRWQVAEIVCDPFRWRRTMEVLEQERLPVVEHPQTSAWMTPATTGFYEAAVNLQVTHAGDPDLTRHVLNARVVEDNRGTRLAKDAKNSPRKIDAAVAGVMAHSRARWRATNNRKRRARSFK